MANRYCNLDGTKLIKNDFKNINTGFEIVQAEVDTHESRIDAAEIGIKNMAFTGSTHDALVTASFVDTDNQNFGPDGDQTYLDGRLSKWENRTKNNESALGTTNQILSEKASVFEVLGGNLNVYSDDTKTVLLSAINLSSLADTAEIQAYINSLVTAGTITGATIGDKSLNPGKTIFQQIDLSTVTYESGFYIHKTNGLKAANAAQYYASSYIDFDYGGLYFLIKTCTTNDLAGLAFYDSNNVCVGGLTTGYSTTVLTETIFQVPLGAKKIRFTCVGADKLTGILLAIISNPIDIAKTLIASTLTHRVDAIEKSDSAHQRLLNELYGSYFFGDGTVSDVPEVFKKTEVFTPSKGTVTLINNQIIITSITDTTYGGCGFRTILPSLTPEIIKYVNEMTIEFDVTMAVPSEMSYRIGIYAVQHDGTVLNAATPLVVSNDILSASLSQHISKKFTFTYQDIDNIISPEEITIDQIECFGLYVNSWSIFSDNTVTISNLYFKQENNIIEQIESLKTTDLNIQDQINVLNGTVQDQLYHNYALSETELFDTLRLNNAPLKGDVVIDKINKVVTIDNTNSLTYGSAGIRFTLPNFYQLLQEKGELTFKLTGHATFNGSLGFQLYPHNATANFATAIINNTYVDTGLGVDLVMELTTTLVSIQDFFTQHSYDIATLDHFEIYIRALTISNDFDCTITDLQFYNPSIIDTIQLNIENIENEIDTFNQNNTISPSGELPLQFIKRDGGLFSIFHKVGYIGDSLSSGEHEYTKPDGGLGHIDLFDFSYGQAIARATGTTALNFSIGGTTAATWLTNFADTAFNIVDNICVAYVIYLGTNDLDSNKNPYGMGDTTTDIDINDYNNNGLTFAGRYATIIQRIKEAQPKARIFCCTVPKWPTTSTDKATNPIIRQITEMFDYVYLLDLWQYAETISNDYRVGFHLSAAGYQVFGWQVMSYIDYLIRKYPLEFKEVAFIGTDYHYIY